MKTTNKRTEVILTALESKGFQHSHGYGENGYNADVGVILGNWNDVSDRIADYLKLAGYEIEWDDEWITDYSTGLIYRCVSDGYEWKPAYILNEWTNWEVIPITEVEQDQILAEDYINDYLLNDSNHISVANINDHLKRLGFQSTDKTYESGLREGRNDNSKGILKYWNDKKYDVVFSGYDSSQFYIEFYVHIRKMEG